MKNERDLLTLRLKDKLINEDIQLPGWDIVEARITKYKSMVIEFAAQAFKVDWVFLALQIMKCHQVRLARKRKNKANKGKWQKKLKDMKRL